MALLLNIEIFNVEQVAVEYNVAENETKPAINMTVTTETTGDSVLITVCMT